MAVEDQIAALLANGQSPANLVSQGFKKSTVYKVATRLRSETSTVPSNGWMVTVTPNLDGIYLLPGHSQVLQITVTNKGVTPWLVTQAGIAPAWLASQQQWLSWPEQILLEPGKSHRCKPVTLSVPPSQALGEHELYIGFYGQWLDAQTRVALAPQMEWSRPLVFRVQHRPRTQKYIVLITATIDIPLARQMALSLENIGFRTIVACDEDEATKRRAMDQSLLVMGLFTRKGGADTAGLNDLRLAEQLNRRVILYQETDTVLPSEWQSRCHLLDMDSPNRIFQTVQNDIDQALQEEGQAFVGLGAALAGGLLMLLAALSAGE